jgi:hypothetical protein
MKFSLYSTVLLGTAVSLWSCSKNYLTRSPYNSVPLSSAIQTTTDLQVAAAGMYSELRTTDLYGRTLPVKGDVMADNTFVTASNSGRYLPMNSYATTNTDAYAGAAWPNAYIAIKYANTIIHTALPASTATNAQYIGEAYAVRALMHFELVRNFAHPYTLAPNDPGIPIVLSYNQSSEPSRSNFTVKQVYTQVVSDLDSAMTLMTTYRGTAYFSKYAAEALLARVYQNMGDWTDAEKAALDVINNSGWTMLAAKSYVSPSGSLGTGGASATNNYSPGGYWASPAVQSGTKFETLFEVASDLANNNGFDQIGFMYLQVGGGYGDILGTDSLYNLYSATDVRLGLNPRAPAGYRTGEQGNINLCYKYPNPAGSGDHDDTKVLRLSDIILIAAEAYYNAGDFTNANKYLNMVAQQRDPAFAGWADTGPQVLEDILTERRKELAFEGNRFWDLVRLGRSFTKWSSQVPLKTIAIAPGNQFLVWPIPVAEINANPGIGQNPGY